MTEESDNALVPFDQWKDELEIRASQHSFNSLNTTVPLLMLGIIAAFTFDFFRD